MATANSRKRLAASQPGASRAGATGGAAQPTAVNSLMEEIRSFGRLPRRVRGQEAAQKAERALADRMIRAKNNQCFSGAQLAELDELTLPRRVRSQEATDVGGASQSIDQTAEPPRSRSRSRSRGADRGTGRPS